MKLNTQLANAVITAYKAKGNNPTSIEIHRAAKTGCIAAGLGQQGVWAVELLLDNDNAVDWAVEILEQETGECPQV